MEQYIEYIQWVVAILSGIAVCVPLAIALYKAGKNVIKAGNWTIVIRKCIDLMEVAEQEFSKGIEKKAWVLDMLRVFTKDTGIEYNEEVIAAMIDVFCAMAKKINK